MASIMTLLEKKEESIILHFPSLITMGTITENLARLNKWDQEYITKVQQLYKMDDHDVKRWTTIVTKFLGQSQDNATHDTYFQNLFPGTMQSDGYYQFKIPSPAKVLIIPSDDFKMMSLGKEL